MVDTRQNHIFESNECYKLRIFLSHVTIEKDCIAFNDNISLFSCEKKLHGCCIYKMYVVMMLGPAKVYCIHMVISFLLLIHLSRKLIGELLVYRGIRRPSVVNIFKRLLL